MGHAQDGVRRVASDPRQSDHSARIPWEDTSVVADNLAGGRVEIPRPAGVAKSRPGGEDLFLAGRGEGSQIGEVLQKRLISAPNHLGAGLLEHHFRDPDFIRILSTTPREIPAVLIKPVQETESELSGVNRIYLA